MTPSAYAQFMLSIPTPPLPVVFALVWLGSILLVDRVKEAATKRERAGWTMVAFAMLWSQGVIYVLQAGLIK